VSKAGATTILSARKLKKSKLSTESPRLEPEQTRSVQKGKRASEFDLKPTPTEPKGKRKHIIDLSDDDDDDDDAVDYTASGAGRQDNDDNDDNDDNEEEAPKRPKPAQRAEPKSIASLLASKHSKQAQTFVLPGTGCLPANISMML
jgi:hypothetical protein